MRGDADYEDPERKPLIAIGLALCWLAVFTFLSFCSRDPNQPVPEAEIQSVLGCYSAGKAAVKIERHAIKVDLGDHVYRSRSIGFDYEKRGLAVSSEIWLRYDIPNNRLAFETDKEGVYTFMFDDAHPDHVDVAGDDGRPPDGRLFRSPGPPDLRLTKGPCTPILQ
jgi:hypothetical protein